MGRLAIVLLTLSAATAGDAARAQQEAPASAPAVTGSPGAPTPSTPAEPSAEIKACIERLGDLAKRSPLFIRTLCRNENGIIPGNTTAMVPPLLPAEGFQGLIFDRTG